MPKLTAAVGAHDGVVVAVVIKVFIGDIAVAFRQQAQIIGVDKSSDGRIVISRFKIVPRQIDIVIVLFVADRVDLRNVVFMVKLCLPSVTNYMDLYGFVNRRLREIFTDIPIPKKERTCSLLGNRFFYLKTTLFHSL